MAYTAYADYSYYSTVYGGTAISNTGFAPVSIQASIELDSMTFRRIRIAGLSSYDDDTQDLIKMSACILADAIYEIQDSTGSSAGAVTTASESVNGYSYSVGSAATYDSMMTTARSRVKTLLLSTGLISSAVEGSYIPWWMR